MTIMKAEWQIAIRNKRLLFFNIVVPIVFIAPLILSGAPGVHVTVILVVLFALFSTFGSSIPLIRDKESGLLQRYVMTGVNPGFLLLQRTLVFALIDFLQLVPAQALIIVVTAGNFGEISLFMTMVFLALIAGNLFGVLAASASRSIAEGALFSSFLGLFMIHFAGVFRVAVPGSLVSIVEPWIPFRPLYLSVRTIVLGAEPVMGSDLAPPLFFTLVLIMGTYCRGKVFLGTTNR